jgi:hypothetical protein
MNGYRESDSLIVSKKPLNKTGDNKPVAEKVEKRRLAERNPSKRNRNQAQSWIGYGMQHNGIGRNSSYPYGTMSTISED